MNTFYTTGEVAKECGVSVRTVQYYDRNNIVKPSQISEGGRRYYTEEDVDKFKCVCFYKSLGFSLNEIKTMIKDKSSWISIANFISNQEQKLDDEIHKLLEKKKRLHLLNEEIHQYEKLTVHNMDELNAFVQKKEKHRKTGTITYMLLGFYIVIVVIGFIISSFLGGIFPYMMIPLMLILLCMLIYYHASTNAYVCPHCHQKFTISFLKDVVTLNNGKKGKILTCPYCGLKSSMKETHRDT